MNDKPVRKLDSLLIKSSGSNLSLWLSIIWTPKTLQMILTLEERTIWMFCFVTPFATKVSLYACCWNTSFSTVKTLQQSLNALNSICQWQENESKNSNQFIESNVTTSKQIGLCCWFDRRKLNPSWIQDETINPNTNQKRMCRIRFLSLSRSHFFKVE